MKKVFLILIIAMMTAITTVSAYKLNRVSVHDPSVVWEPSSKYYYIFGSHLACARTKDMMSWSSTRWSWGQMNGTGGVTANVSNANAFTSCATKTVTKQGEQVTFPDFNAHDWSAAYGNYDISGNMWAPDVIYNEKMKKWCMYMSINGPKWNSSIVLLTADNITGPYVYQGPVIISGFNISGAPASLSYKNTDMELAIGSMTTIPSRYTSYWGSRWPHCIDPCVFYDKEGGLWMSYGSWSGGIWILKLNEENGLRDYDTTYLSVGGSTDGVTSDPYFGKKIAGGFYSSGEGSYIEYIGGYYYLFISNGGLAAGGDTNDYNNGGYQMRVFRSMTPDGPYTDAMGRKAVLTAYELNFGPNSSMRGINIFGAYGYWGDMLSADGERSQGHNSVISAPDGRTYLVYHSRFQNSGEWHQVRVHQLFQNEDGWLVAAPFEYTGEQVTDGDITTRQIVNHEQVTGTYKLLTHRYGLDHRKKELATPIDVVLHNDGTISGDANGTWSLTDGKSYVTMVIGGVQYKGVVIEQTMEPSQTKQTVAFTALAKSGVTVWGYRTGEDPTPVQTVKAESKKESMVFYDIMGRRVSKLGRSGIYINQGRKVMMRKK